MIAAPAAAMATTMKTEKDTSRPGVGGGKDGGEGGSIPMYGVPAQPNGDSAAATAAAKVVAGRGAGWDARRRGWDRR